MFWITRIRVCLLAVTLLGSVALAGQIHDAANGGDSTEVRRLLAADRSLVNAVDDAGNTPLHVACWRGQPNVVALLVSAGADLEIADKQGMTPLRVAIYTMKPDVVKLLLDKGARTDGDHPMFGGVMNQAFSITCQKGGDPTLVEMLIAHGLQLDAGKVDAMGMAPLDWAVHFGNLAMARLALDHGANVNLVSPSLGRPPLVAAVSKGQSELVNLFLARGADVSIADKLGNPPIFYAVEQGRTQILELLLSRGASVGFVESHYGRSLLHLAATSGYRDIADNLVTHGANVNAVDGSGRTPLFYAIKYANSDVASYLKEQGATGSKNAAESFALTKGVQAGMAKIWYLDHRGWVVGMKDHTLIFDAEEFDVRRPDNPCLANGFLTKKELERHDVIGLYSCYHGNPGEPAYIHTLADSLDRAAFVHLVDDAWRGSLNTTYLRGQADTAVADLRIQAIDIGSGMPMLAYLCHTGGLHIYYQAFATEDTSKLKEGYEFLKHQTDTIDIAFLPMPEPEQEESDIRLFLGRFPTRSLVLHDPNRRNYMPPDTAARIAEWGYPVKAFCPENSGDHFEYRRPGK